MPLTLTLSPKGRGNKAPLAPLGRGAGGEGMEITSFGPYSASRRHRPTCR